MEEIIDILERAKLQINKLITQKIDYFYNRKEEVLKDNTTIDENRLLIQGENILDRYLEMKHRLYDMSNVMNKLEFFVNTIQKRLKEINDWIKDEDNIIDNLIKNLFDIMKQIRQRKTVKEINKTLKFYFFKFSF